MAAAVTMIANITVTPDPMPSTTSPRIADMCPRVGVGTPPSAVISSTSSAPCQKNRYGEMVVPNSAMTAATVGPSRVRPGTNVRNATSPHETSMKNSTATYDRIERHSHRRKREYVL